MLVESPITGLHQVLEFQVEKHVTGSHGMDERVKFTVQVDLLGAESFGVTPGGISFSEPAFFDRRNDRNDWTGFTVAPGQAFGWEDPGALRDPRSPRVDAPWRAERVSDFLLSRLAKAIHDGTVKTHEIHAVHYEPGDDMNGVECITRTELLHVTTVHDDAGGHVAQLVWDSQSQGNKVEITSLEVSGSAIPIDMAPGGSGFPISEAFSCFGWVFTALHAATTNWAGYSTEVATNRPGWNIVPGSAKLVKRGTSQFNMDFQLQSVPHGLIFDVRLALTSSRFRGMLALIDDAGDNRVSGLDAWTIINNRRLNAWGYPSGIGSPPNIMIGLETLENIINTHLLADMADSGFAFSDGTDGNPHGFPPKFHVLDGKTRQHELECVWKVTVSGTDYYVEGFFRTDPQHNPVVDNSDPDPSKWSKSSNGYAIQGIYKIDAGGDKDYVFQEATAGKALLRSSLGQLLVSNDAELGVI